MCIGKKGSSIAHIETFNSAKWNANDKSWFLQKELVMFWFNVSGSCWWAIFFILFRFVVFIWVLMDFLYANIASDYHLALYCLYYIFCTNRKVYIEVYSFFYNYLILYILVLNHLSFISIAQRNENQI